MSIEVKFRRGTATQHLSFTGANGEITVDTTNKTLRVHDGVTVGGTRLAKFGETSGNTSSYLQVANASALYATKAYAASNAYVKLILANTNAYIASVAVSGGSDKATWSALTSTNTAIRTLVSDRLQVANAAAIYQIKTVERAALANTNSYIATKASWSALTSTNTTIRLLVSDRLQVANVRSYIQVANVKIYLANTNAYIATRASWSALTGTNTALRTLISDRLQVANAASTYETKSTANARLANTNAYIATRASWTALTGTNTALRTLISDRLQVANAAATYETKSDANAKLANTNAYIATRASWSALTSTNTSIRNYVDTKVASVINSAPAALDTLYELANALNNDASFATTVTNLIGTKISVANTKAYLANTNAFIKSQLANTNAYIATKASWSALTSTNTVIRSLLSDRLQVANASATYQTKVVERAALANTNSYIATKVNTTTFNAALANTNAYINSVVVSGGATWSSITSTNTALRTLISDRLQVANAAASYQTKTVERAALANTNAYIATKASWSALISTNTSIRSLVNDRLQVANAKSYMQVSNTKTYLANTNAYILTVSNRERAALANTNLYIATKVNTTTFNAALANTNAYIASISAGSSGATWSALISTNTALRTLIDDRLQVANAAAVYQTKTVERAALANTNAYVATRATWASLAGTNTALRTLINDRLQVANASTLYATKSNPATSGLLAHTGRATISTNLAVSGNASVTGTMTASGIVSGSELVSTNASGDEGGEIKLTKPPNGTLDGGITIDAYQNKLRIFEQGGSARGVYIDLSAAAGGVGTNLLAGGGTSSNSFSGILVGANVISADSTSDRLTFVAGTGIALAANPTTDTITISATGGGGGGGFSNGQSISVTNLVVTGNTTLNTFKFVPRVSSTSSITSPLAWNSDNFDQYVATAQSTALTINADSGTPNNGQRIIFRFKDNGTARALTWTTGSSKSFRAIGVTLPTTTIINKTLYVGAIYNTTDERWDVIAVAQES